MSRLNDLTGKQFGRLTVIERAPDAVSPSGRHRVKWLCQCECGNTREVYTDNLLRGRTVSCGCNAREKAQHREGNHHESRTKLYGVWCAMKRRCLNSSVPEFKYYGGRGITVCDDWMSSWESFRDWAYNSGYKEGLTLERINVNGNYEPSNCCWITGIAQANNRRSNRRITFNGETHNLTEWANKLGINYKTLHNRLYVGWSVEKAFTT